VVPLSAGGNIYLSSSYPLSLIFQLSRLLSRTAGQNSGILTYTWAHYLDFLKLLRKPNFRIGGGWLDRQRRIGVTLARGLRKTTIRENRSRGSRPRLPRHVAGTAPGPSVVLRPQLHSDPGQSKKVIQKWE